jgi:hypothetical protein
VSFAPAGRDSPAYELIAWRAQQVAHLPGLRSQHKARPDQIVRQQFGQPCGIVNFGLASRDVLHVRPHAAGPSLTGARLALPSRGQDRLTWLAQSFDAFLGGAARHGSRRSRTCDCIREITRGRVIAGLGTRTCPTDFPYHLSHRGLPRNVGLDKVLVVAIDPGLTMRVAVDA